MGAASSTLTGLPPRLRQKKHNYPPYADSSEQQRPGTTYRLALRADASARIQIVSDSLTTTPADDATLPRVSVPSIVHKAALIAYQRRYRL
jgi:hypothetical protein